MKIVTIAFITIVWATPTFAQARRPAATRSASAEPKVSFRPFLEVVGEQFAAKKAFRATFGESFEPYWGGGLQVTFGSFYVDATAARLEKTGQRAFRFNDQDFRLGIPLTMTDTAFEMMGGYRFKVGRRARV